MFFSTMFSQIGWKGLIELCLRLLIAAVCGGLIGMERGHRLKAAGIRTHSLVACSAALLMIISKYGFMDLADSAGNLLYGTKGADPSRIASQVVAGISFLGVGVIYRDRGAATKGLTTAAGLWATMGVGMAAGAGMYTIGIFAAFFILILQYMTHRFSAFNTAIYNAERLIVVMDEDVEALKDVNRQLTDWGFVVITTELMRRDDHIILTAYVRNVRNIGDEEFAGYLLGNSAINSIKLYTES